MLDWQLFTGPVPWVFHGGALAACLWLGWRTWRTSRRPAFTVVMLVAGAIVAIGVARVCGYLARDVLTLFPDSLSVTVYAWTACAVFVVGLAAFLVAVDGRWRRALTTVTAAIVVVACCGNQVNAFFGAYPSLRYALGIQQADDVPLPPPRAGVVAALPGRSLESVWTAAPDQPSRGKLTSATIPGRVSAFTARTAKVYLPPAYFAARPPKLPVLVLLTGQPGTPQDWIGAGRLTSVMDAFAAAHRGLAPVVVIPDPTGSAFADPLCLDSRLGRADTYLSVDVPAWIERHLTVDTRKSAWAVAGASYGGTCALQLATNHPDVYPTFLDIAGSAEPTLGDRARTVGAAFGGDERTFERVNPLTLLRTRSFHGSGAAVVVGISDHDARGDASRVVAAARAAGMDSHLTELPGAHDWRLFSAGLAHELPFVARRMAVID